MGCTESNKQEDISKVLLGPFCWEKELALPACSAGVHESLRPLTLHAKPGFSPSAWHCRNKRAYLGKSWALCSAGFLVSPDEADELEHLVTSRTESVNIDHPNHIVTVTTISDLDLSGARQLGLTTPVVKPLAASLIISAINILGAGWVGLVLPEYAQRPAGV